MRLTRRLTQRELWLRKYIQQQARSPNSVSESSREEQRDSDCAAQGSAETQKKEQGGKLKSVMPLDLLITFKTFILKCLF